MPVALAVDDKTLYVQIHYPRSQMRTTSLFRMKKLPSSSRELIHVYYTDADVTGASQPMDADSVYYTTPSYYPEPDGPLIVRIRKRW